MCTVAFRKIRSARRSMTPNYPTRKAYVCCWSQLIGLLLTPCHALQTLDFARGSKRDTGFGGKRAAATPGPGHYDPGASLNTAPEDLASSSLLSQVRRGALAKSRSKRSTRTAPAGMQRTRQLESAVFRSKTPMVHNRKVKKSTEPGPGDYKGTPSRGCSVAL